MSRRSAGADRSAFARPRRREVALACSFGPRTVSEIARQLSTEPGSVTSVISALKKEGVLVETQAAHADGRAFALDERWRPALLEAIGSEAPRGLLEPTHRLLIVGSRDASVAAAAAAIIAGDPVVLWVARLEGPARLMAVARGADADERTRVDRLEASLASAGADCVQLAVARILDLGDFVAYAKTISQPSSPAGTAGGVLSPPRPSQSPKPG